MVSPTEGVPEPAVRLACWLSTAAVFVLPAAVLSLPVNLLPFGVLLLLSSLLCLPRLRHGWRQAGWLRWWLLVGSAGVLGMGLLSLLLNGLPLRGIDNLARLLAIPWALAWVLALRPPMRCFWMGAVVGLGLAALLALWQCWQGQGRAAGWSNPIVLADGAVILLAVVFFCRPADSSRWWLWGSMAACVLVVLLTGSRGAWPALLLVLGVAFLCSSGHACRTRIALFIIIALGLMAIVLVSPGLREQVRLQEFGQDIVRLQHGDGDSSLGARLRLWQAAARTLVSTPWTGVGIGRFDSVVAALPECAQGRTQDHICMLDHAHSDLAEWAATGGVLGIVALLMVYGLPLLVFLQLWQRQRCLSRGPALAGLVVVGVYVVCGLSQSMFDHQLSAGLYASMVGLLAGWGGLQSPSVGDHPPAGPAPATTA